MQLFKGFTLTWKKGRLYGLALGLIMMMLLAGCGTTSVQEVNSTTPGFFTHYVVFPLTYSMEHIATWFGGSYGLAIIILTLAVRFALFPLMMRQAKGQQGMKRKMSIMQPELDRLKKKYENKTGAEDKQNQQKEMMEIYKKHSFNPLNIGCLPILIQLPILSGMYTAIRATPELASHSFLWFKLGEPNWIMAIIVALLYMLQAKVSQYNMTPEQQKQFAIMGYLSPIMMAFFSFSAPAAMPLYWMVSGSFLLVQTLLFRKMYPNSIPVQTALEIEVEPEPEMLEPAKISNTKAKKLARQANQAKNNKSAKA